MCGKRNFQENVLQQVMRRVPCADVCPSTSPVQVTNNRTLDNKELLRQQLVSRSVSHKRTRQKNRWKLKFHHQALPQEYLHHYEQSLQKANNKLKPQQQKTDNNTNETFKIWAQRLAGIQDESKPSNMNANIDDKRKKSPAITPSKIVTYDDLPYMGEMTLNNSKPRRGRKPKKADICHLIYENYGTVVPGQPPPDTKLNQATMCPPLRVTDTPKTDLQNKIISSLLERKLSQENRKRLETTPPSFVSPNAPMEAAPLTVAGPLHSDEEPLNLCIRDLHELKLQVQRKFGNIYPSLEIKSEPEEQPNAISVIQKHSSAVTSPAESPDTTPECAGVPTNLALSPQNWSDAALSLHSQLLYYSSLAQQQQQQTLNQAEPIEPQPEENKNKLVLKQISELMDPKMTQVEEKSPEPKKRSSPKPGQGPVKRKRSAIFIPPVPVKTNSATPTAEVSICKFKFTGGSKPSLQEKKMLSVDSGGNFRYYSGTGSKNKGYEYMQRDPVPTQEASTSKAKDEELTIKKKRKSRKSVQREQLEQRFKEKGFLIQTQQLESAEGATYCKFRQLRKFTRYLFRSWKDYLPGDLAPGGVPREGVTQQGEGQGSSQPQMEVQGTSQQQGGDWG